MGGQNKREGGGGISKNQLISVMNEKRDKCLILMLNLKVSKQTRSEASKNNVIIKRVSNDKLRNFDLDSIQYLHIVYRSKSNFPEKFTEKLVKSLK